MTINTSNSNELSFETVESFAVKAALLIWRTPAHAGSPKDTVETGKEGSEGKSLRGKGATQSQVQTTTGKGTGPKGWRFQEVKDDRSKDR